jgi:hypothetical protein
MAEVTSAEKEAAKIAKEEAAKNKFAFSVSASFKAVDEEGVMVRVERSAKGDSYEAAATAVDFPKGINALITVRLSRDDVEEFTKAISPNKAQRIFVDKDMFEFGRAFRGV